MRKHKTKNLPKGVLVDDGYVKIRIFPNGKQFKKCVGPITQPGVIDLAIAKLNQYREQIRLGKFEMEAEVKRLTVEQACDIYSKFHAEGKASAREFKRMLGYIKTAWAGRYVDEITYLDVQDYRRLREKQVMPTTVNREHTVITHLFNKLKELRRLKKIVNVRLPEENPGSLVKKANERAYARKRVLSPEEFHQFMAVAPLTVRRVCLAAINSLLRKKDLQLLDTANINRASGNLEGKQAKTGKAYAVPINGNIQKLLEEASEKRIFDFKNFRKLFDKARADSKLPHFQFRDLRRTGARLMLAKGMDLAVVSKYLGHSTINMTEVYVSPSNKDLQIAGEVLGSMFTDKTENPNNYCPKNCPNASHAHMSQPVYTAS